MSRQVETAPAAVVEGAGVAVMTEATRPPVVDRGLVAQLVGDAQRQGLSVDGVHIALGGSRCSVVG